MKENLKKTLIIFWLTCICFHSSLLKTQAEESIFTGVRTMELKADQSDIENFINGGRTAFDFVIRSHAPEWLNYTLKTVGRDAYLNFSFEFTSYDDYCAKLEELLQYAPSVVWIEDNGTLLVENFDSFELLNFFNSGLEEAGCLIEKTPEELFSNITLDTIEINGEEHRIEGRVNIRPKGRESIKFDEVEMSTVGRKDGTFNRSIIVKLNSASKGQKNVEDIIERLCQMAKVKEEYLIEGGVKITADFEAYNSEDLVRKTMICLNATTSIQEMEEYVDDTTVRVKRVEFIDISSLLNENGVFRYSYEFPSYYQNVTGKEDSAVIINETSMVSQNESYMECYYERGFQFDEIEIYSDFSSWFGKKKRTVKLNTDIDTAQFYHEVIKEELSNKLEKGMILDIYDDGKKRCYEISYSSYLMKEIEEFSEAILGSVCRMDIDESWIPFAQSTLKENILINEIIPQMSPARETVISYKLLPMSKVADMEEDSVVVEDNLITYRKGNSVLVDINYKTLNLLKCMVEVLVLVFVIIFAIIVYVKIKKLIKKRKQNEDERKLKEEYLKEHLAEGQMAEEKILEIHEDVKEGTEIRCPQCGNFVSTEARFCGKCGVSLQVSDDTALDIKEEQEK